MREKTVMNALITQTRAHGIIRVVTVLLAVCFLAENVFALGGYWKPVGDKSYTVKFTDEAKNVVLGKFKKIVRWEWDEKGNVTITKWDEGAIFMFKDKEGKEHKIHNATIKVRILDLAPGMTGKLKGNINAAADDKKLAETRFAAKERVLGRLRANYAKGSIAFAPDGSRYAYACGSQGQQQMIVGDSAGEVVVFCSVPQFSPVRNEFHYLAIRRSSPRQLKVDLIAGDKTIPTDFTPGAGAVFFSDDGSHYAAIGGRVLQEDGRRVTPAGVTVIIDGRVIGRYKDVSYPVFSPNGAKYAFVALNDDEPHSRCEG